MDQITDPAVVVRADGVIEHANDAFATLVGIDKARLSGASADDDLVPEPYGPWMMAALEQEALSPTGSAEIRTPRAAPIPGPARRLLRDDASGHSVFLFDANAPVSATDQRTEAPFDGVCYRVKRTRDGALLLENGPAKGRPCHEVHFGRPKPCKSCPVPQSLDERRLAESAWVSEDESMQLVRSNPVEFDVALCERIALAPPTTEMVLLARIEHRIAAARLSPRERDVLLYLRLGRTIEEIAVILNLSYHTIKFHTANLLDKLGADSRVDLLRILT